MGFRTPFSHAQTKIRFPSGLAVVAGEYSQQRDNDGTNQMHWEVPTGAGYEWSINNVAHLLLSASGLEVPVTSALLTVTNQTNTGVHHVGGGGTTNVADNETATFEMADIGVFAVRNATGGYGGLFGASKDSATVVALVDPGSNFDVTDVDNTKIAVFKSAVDDTVSIKNYTNGTIALTVWGLTVITAATGPV